MATTFSASLRSTRTRILLIALTVAVLLGYGLLAAERARSATLTKKAFAGVKVDTSGGTATLVHPSHVTGVSRLTLGRYKVTFDRHVDNCSHSATPNFNGEGTGHVIIGLENGFYIGGTFTTSDELVVVEDSASRAAIDSDFDIIVLCPGT